MRKFSLVLQLYAINTKNVIVVITVTIGLEDYLAKVKSSLQNERKRSFLEDTKTTSKGEASFHQEKPNNTSQHQSKGTQIQKKAARNQWESCYREPSRSVLSKISQFLLAQVIQYAQQKKQFYAYENQKSQMSPTILDLPCKIQE